MLKKDFLTETYEWDSPWWEHTENKASPRALYIGDSISHGTRPQLNTLSGEKLIFDGFATSKALDNPFLKPSLELFLSQMNRLDCILFNNGLHGWHLSDAAYQQYYRDMLVFLAAKKVPVFVVLTTHLPFDTEKDVLVLRRNAIASALAEEFGNRIVDLYAVSSALPSEDYCGDGVHFKEHGYKALAETVLKEVF